MTNLTNKELDVLKSIDKCEYGDYLTDSVWSWSLEYNVPEGSEVTKNNIAGVVGSLNKKGLLYSYDNEGNGNPDDACTSMTEEGKAAYIEAVGAENVQKPVSWSKETGTLMADGSKC